MGCTLSSSSKGFEQHGFEGSFRPLPPPVIQETHLRHHAPCSRLGTLRHQKLYLHSSCGVESVLERNLHCSVKANTAVPRQTKLGVDLPVFAYVHKSDALHRRKYNTAGSSPMVYPPSPTRATTCRHCNTRSAAHVSGHLSCVHV